VPDSVIETGRDLGVLRHGEILAAAPSTIAAGAEAKSCRCRHSQPKCSSSHGVLLIELLLTMTWHPSRCHDVSAFYVWPRRKARASAGQTVRTSICKICTDQSFAGSLPLLHTTPLIGSDPISRPGNPSTINHLRRRLLIAASIHVTPLRPPFNTPDFPPFGHRRRGSRSCARRRPCPHAPDASKA